jgi:hypothetical protein
VVKGLTDEWGVKIYPMHSLGFGVEVPTPCNSGQASPIEHLAWSLPPISRDESLGQCYGACLALGGGQDWRIDPQEPRLNLRHHVDRTSQDRATLSTCAGE